MLHHFREAKLHYLNSSLVHFTDTNRSAHSCQTFCHEESISIRSHLYQTLSIIWVHMALVLIRVSKMDLFVIYFLSTSSIMCINKVFSFSVLVFLVPGLFLREKKTTNERIIFLIICVRQFMQIRMRFKTPGI